MVLTVRRDFMSRIELTLRGLSVRFVLIASIALAFGNITAFAVNLKGTIKDDKGQPLRAARVTAAAGYRTVSRYTDGAGRYTIAGLKPDAYEVSATAWGFERKLQKKELAADAEMNFSLAPKWDVTQLTSAEWISAVPEEED